MSHWVVAPVLLPLAAGLALVLLAGRGLFVQRVVSVGATLGGAALAVALVAVAGRGPIATYRLGDWAPPFGIVLVLDRLAALMLLLVAAVALGSVLHAVSGADRQGPYFHALFQLQLVGLNGAFLTGDLFNLFVCFEILLIASYCLLVYGTGAARLVTGLHYVLLNLAGSALFLVGIGILYGVTGTLNLADLARRVAALPAADAGLAQAAGLLLLVVFALKAALVPLYFWLPSAYAAASAPVAALFAVMTKVGVYAIVRLYTLVFGAGAGGAADVAAPWLLPLALVTIVLGALGAFASGSLRRLQGYLLIGSVGVMLAAVGLFEPAALAAGLFYMAHSTIAFAAMFLLADLVARQRGERHDQLASGGPALQGAALGPLYFGGAIAVAGLPPLSGFLGKAWILAATPPTLAGHWLWAIVLASSLAALLTLARAGVTLFWRVEETHGDPAEGAGAAASPAALAPAAGLLALLVVLTLAAGPVASYLGAAADSLFAPDRYITAVLGDEATP
jgi:multicomponent K+:H+ antiporter subunit D